MRDLTKSLPSPTELWTWQNCHKRWAIGYGLGYHAKEKGVALIVGAGLSDALAEYYGTESRKLPHADAKARALLVYESAVRVARSTNLSITDEEWLPAVQQGNNVLRLYVNTYTNTPTNWEVIGVQYRLESPAPMVLDMLVRDVDSGLPRVVETKSISPFADLDFEMFKYDMGWQPISYCVGAEQVLQEKVNNVTMEFLVKGAPAKKVNNRNYKAIDPSVERRNITIEEWKKQMWLNTAQYENALMQQLQGALNEGVDLIEIPCKTQSCVYQLGYKTFTCPCYPICSANMHPSMLQDLFTNSREEVKAKQAERPAYSDAGGDYLPS